MLLFVECAIACLLFHWLVYRSVTKNPLSWIGSYPPAIQERVKQLGIADPTQKTRFSKVEITRKIIAFLGFILFGALVIFYLNGQKTFWAAFLSMFAIMLSITWYDAFIVDCLWFCQSPKVRIKGTEDMDKAYKNYAFHIVESCKGTLLSIAIAGLTASCVSLLAFLHNVF